MEKCLWKINLKQVVLTRKDKIKYPKDQMLNILKKKLPFDNVFAPKK